MIGIRGGAMVVLLLGGCSAMASAPLPTTDACLIAGNREVPITVELARTPEQRSKGLMGRTELAGNAGMLFIYASPRRPDQGFWMYRTLIPLDIAYLDENGVIGAIVAMAPCPSERGSECPSYPAGVPYSLALEMNQGFFEAHDISVGDRLEWAPDACTGAR